MWSAARRDGSVDIMLPAAPRRRVILVRVILGVATVLAVLGILAVWANRQALNADNWADTSADVLAEPAVKAQVADFLVDEVYSSVDVAGELRDALPQRLDPLAGPVAGGLRQGAARAPPVTPRRLAPRAGPGGGGLRRVATRSPLVTLGRPRVEKAWEEANRLTAQQFINIAEGNSGAVGARGNAVVLNLHVILLDLVQRLGLPGRAVSRIPEDAGRVTILRADQVQTLQDVTSLLKGLALILPILSLGLFAAAVALAQGHRRTTLLWAGIDLAAAGVVVLLVRNLLGGSVVDALAGTGPVRPAAEATWDIGTAMLRDTA